MQTEMNAPRPDPKALKKFYLDHLNEVIEPFWLDRGIDREHGGYFTCFDNTGGKLLSTDKYVWSQGRFVYVLAATAELTGRDEPYLRLAKSGARFLLRHAILRDGRCAFLLARDGTPKPAGDTNELATSTYADCFVAAGLARYAAAARDRAVLDEAARLYDSICERIDAGRFRTDPYTLPQGCRAHGVAMIALNTGQELLEAMQSLGDGRAERIGRRCDKFVRQIMDRFADGPVVREVIAEDGRAPDNILGRYVNPGHTAESMWFVMHHARRTGDAATIDRAAGLVKHALRLGWDERYGGLFQYVDADGGQPRGSTAGVEGCPMVAKLRNDWDNKLLWVHAEALYASLLAYALTGDRELASLHERLGRYTFATFPNPDRSIGEWIQIRDRTGAPAQKTTCLPVKDPMVSANRARPGTLHRSSRVDRTLRSP